MSSSTGTRKWRPMRHAMRSSQRWTLLIFSGIGTLGGGVTVGEVTAAGGKERPIGAV